MEFYEDFNSTDEIIPNFSSLNNDTSDFIQYDDNLAQLKHKSKNKFVFESFSTRLKNLKLRLNQNIDKDYNLLILNNENEEILQKKKILRKNDNKGVDIEGEEEINLIESNFKILLEREKSINSKNSEFLNFYNKLNVYSFSYLYIVNNYKKIFDIIKDEIKQRYEDKNIDGLIICFDLLIALIKDIREECYDYFVENNLEQIIKLIKVEGNEIDDNKKFKLIDQVFTFFVNIFKFFEKKMQKNFKKLFLIYSELLFNMNKYIRLFACQSLCYIIKNLSKEEINETFNFLFDIMLNPSKIFELGENNMEIENEENNKDNKENMISNLASKNIVYNMISKDKNGLKKFDSNIKIMIADSISELLTEVLFNIKTISIKADLILEKFKDLSYNKKLDINIIIIFIQSFIKLIKKINNKYTLDAIALFHYFISNFFFVNNNLPNYQKMKSLELKEQIIKIKNIFESNNKKYISYTILCMLIFSKELLLKNFKDNTRTFSDYINDIITEFKDYIFINNKDEQNDINELNKSFIIEISCLIFKFHSNVNISYPLSDFLINNKKYLSFFLNNLIQINSFAFFQAFSLFSFRLAQSKTDNDEYNIIEYNQEKIEEIFNKIINDENIKYENLLEIIDTDEKLFGENLGLIIYEEKQKNILINYIFNYSKNELKKQIENLNEKNFFAIKKLIFVCRMINNEKTTKYIQENIVEEICNIFNKNNKILNTDFKFENIFESDFYYNNKHYMNKIQCLLEMILFCYKNCNNQGITLIKKLLIDNTKSLIHFGIYYTLLNSIIFNEKNNEENETNIDITELNLSKYLINILNSKNNFKYQFSILYKNYLLKKYSSDFKKAELNLINEIFSSVENLLSSNINLTYDKKYSITLEIIVSKLELILSKEGITKHKLDLFAFVFWFLLGCYWISLTKSVWPVLNKMLNQIFNVLIESINISKYSEYKKDIIDLIMNPLNELINFIQKYPREYDFINKNNEIIKNNYITEQKNENENYKDNMNILSDEYKTTANFFVGMPNGLVDSYNILLNSDIDFRNNFIDNIFIDTCSKFDTEGLIIIKELLATEKGKNKNEILNTDYNILFNYIYDKENKTAFNNTIFKLKESLFAIMTKMDNLSEYKNIEKIKKIIYNQIILSKSTLIQKYSIDILSIIDTHIKNYSNLLKEIVDNTNVLIKVNNLEKIMSDDNQLINEEDRKFLMPVMTRLYYSKYFNIKNTEFSANNKKLKTKNKINLVNYFVQLKPEEFDEYISIIFESINKELFNIENFEQKIDYKNMVYNFALLNVRNMKKILEIVKLNLKQITKLFNDNNMIENISNLLINCFIFFKNFGHKIKKNKEEISQNCIKFIKNYTSNKIYNYFNEDEFDKFFSFMTKNIKDLKKEFFDIFIMLFNQFYLNETMIKNLSKKLCDEYKTNLLNKTTLTSNSIFKFFLSLSRHAKLHFIYIINDCQILKSIFNSLQSTEIERKFIYNLIDFFENIISPFSIESLNQNINSDNKINNDDKNYIKENKSKYVEIMEIESDNNDDDSSINNVKDDVPLDDDELIYNFNNIIVNNFNDINKSLTCLIFNEKISPTIKDNLTKKIIEILLNIWSLYINTNTTTSEKNLESIDSIEELFNFIMTIIQNDKGIFNNKEIFDNVLKLLHILIIIKIKKIEKKEKLVQNSEILKIYKILIHLIYKIQNFNSRLLLAIILHEFSILNEGEIFLNVLDYLIELNKNKTGKRELGKELDNDYIIDLINNKLNKNFIKKSIYYIEVIAYQLLVLSSNANINDFALNSSAFEKLKEIFLYISETNNHDKFTDIFNTFFELLKSNFIIYSKILYEIFYTVNSINQNDITGKDLFNMNINLNNDDNSDDINEANFFMDIMNFNIDRRVQALKMLEKNLKNNKNIISEKSIINFIIPVIENFLNYKNYIDYPTTDKKSKKNFIIKHKNETLKEIISSTQNLLPLIIEYPIDVKITKRILLFLYLNLKKISKNNNENNNANNDFVYTVDIFKMTNESLTITLNSIIKVYYNDIKYDEKLKKISEIKINELNQQFIEDENDTNKKEQNNDNIIEEKNRNKKINMDVIHKKNIYFLISNMYNNLFKQLDEEIQPELNKLNIAENNVNNINIFSSREENNSNNNKTEILSSMNLYEILTTEIYPTLKSLLYIDEYREKKNNYYIRNYVITPYLHLVKLISPMKTRSELYQLIIELINNLSSTETSMRAKARDGMKFFISNLDPIFTLKFFESMKSSLHSGYQRHIFAYSVNYLLQFITNYKICEVSLDLIMPILFDELFGDINEEKEIGNLVNKYKEAKENKGLNSMEMIGKNISIKFLVKDLITPMKNYLMKRKNNPEMTQRVNEVILALVKGIKGNILINKENNEIINDMLDYGYVLVDLGVEKNMQNLKEIKKMKNMEIKGGDIYTIDFKNLDNPYVIEVANKFIEEKNEIIYSNLFAVLGLEFFIVLLKNKIFEFSKIDKNSELYEKLNIFLETIFKCIKMTNNTVVVSKSIKIIISMITENEKFFVIKKNLNKITKNLFKLILTIGEGDTSLSQSVLSAISSILSKFNFISVTDSQIKTLLSFLKLNIFNPEIKPYILSCFYSLIKRKILHPDIYDMINYLRDVYLKSFEENTIIMCKKIFFEFINTYPLESKGRLNHLNYFITNCESNTRKCELNSIEMLINFCEKKNFEGIKENIDYLIMKMFTLYANSDDSELKEKIEKLILNLYNNYCDVNNISNNCFKVDYERALNIIENDTNMKMFGIIIISLLLNLKINFVEPNKLIKALNSNLEEEINSMNKYIQDKMNNYDYLLMRNNDNIMINENNKNKNNQENKDKNISDNNWNILYQILSCIERLFSNYIINNNTAFKINKNNIPQIKSLFDNIIQASIHPHSFIKVISLRLILNIILIYDFYNITQTQLNIILSQINFISLSNPGKIFFEEKAFNYCRNILTQIMAKIEFKKNEKILEFLKNMTGGVKKWISNKSNGLIILNRVIDLYDEIIDKIFDDNDKEKNNEVYYIKPIIELCHRINNNQLAEESMKQKCGIMLEKISNKINNKILSQVYKEVNKEISLLKQKRKMEMVDKFRKNNENKNKESNDNDGIKDNKNEKNKFKKNKNKYKKHQNKKKNKNINLNEDDED